MMVDVQTHNPISFLTPEAYKMRMSGSNWFENNDVSSFLNFNVAEDVLDFPQSVPSSSPITEIYYPTSSPETFSSDSSPYQSDVSQTPSPFDASMFQDSLKTEFTDSIEVDPSMFEQCLNPMLLPEIEKILASNPINIPSADNSPMHDASSKKRPRDFDSKTEVSLSRDQLLTMTSKEIEDYVSTLKTKRTLTNAEEKDLKRQRRLVKNREYASQSRSRKKQYVDELEKQLEVSKAETDTFRRQNQMLIEENKILKKQLGSIAEAVKKSQNGGGLSLSSSSGSVSTLTKFTTIGNGKSIATSKTAACLLAIFFVVFSFSIIGDNQALRSSFFPERGVIFNSRTLKSDGNFIQELAPFNEPTPWISTLYNAGAYMSQWVPQFLAQVETQNETEQSPPTSARQPCPHSDNAESLIASHQYDCPHASKEKSS